MLSRPSPPAGRSARCFGASRLCGTPRVRCWGRRMLLWKMIESLGSIAGIQHSVVIVFSLGYVSTDSLDKMKGIDFARIRILFHPTRQDLILQDPDVAQKVTGLLDSCCCRLLTRPFPAALELAAGDALREHLRDKELDGGRGYRLRGEGADLRLPPHPRGSESLPKDLLPHLLEHRHGRGM
mmetsp:Transcript_16102/g.53979  ORF Transcript_16102/g.53979 Transcript_16102/m.53979 type:complete len:182 (-) Transcript_16102:380-925(-)